MTMFNSLIGRAWTVDEMIFEQSPYGAMPTGTPTDGNFMVNLNNLPTYSPANIAPGVVHFTGAVPVQRVNPEMIGYESIGFNPGSVHLYPMNYALGADANGNVQYKPEIDEGAVNIGTLVGAGGVGLLAYMASKSMPMAVILAIAGGLAGRALASSMYMKPAGLI